MAPFLKYFTKYFPLTLGILLIVIGSFFVSWDKVIPYLLKLSPLSITLLLVLGALFYGARIVRYGYILAELGTPLSFGRLVLAYMAAQPVTMLPAGEMYRSVTFNKHGDVDMHEGVPSVFVQSFTENLGLVTIALLSAIALHKYLIIVVVVALINFTVLAFIRKKRATDKGHSLIRRLPFFNISRQRYRRFMKRNRVLLSGGSLIVLLATSFASTLIASAALFITAQAIGVDLSPIQAIIAFALPLILQNISFLPGGLGINEQSSVGVLVLFGVNLPAAVALTLIIRLLTLGLGLLGGLVAIAYTKLSSREKS